MVPDLPDIETVLSLREAMPYAFVVLIVLAILTWHSWIRGEGPWSPQRSRRGAQAEVDLLRAEIEALRAQVKTLGGVEIQPKGAIWSDDRRDDT